MLPNLLIIADSTPDLTCRAGVTMTNLFRHWDKGRLVYLTQREPANADTTVFADIRVYSHQVSVAGIYLQNAALAASFAAVGATPISSAAAQRVLDGFQSDIIFCYTNGVRTCELARKLVVQWDVPWSVAVLEDWPSRLAASAGWLTLQFSRLLRLLISSRARQRALERHDMGEVQRKLYSDLVSASLGPR
jgi:hypothetical protein